MVRLPALLVLMALRPLGYGQDIDYARNVIDTLTSPALHGRGYVNKGEQLAANYIQEEFRRFGLQPAGTDFFQEFPVAVNTFPGRMVVKIDNRELVPGENYLVNPYSRGADGSFRILVLDKETLTDKKKMKQFRSNDFSKCAITVHDTVLNSKEYKDQTALSPLITRVMVDVTDNLGAWAPAAETTGITHVRITEEALDRTSLNIFLSISSEFIPAYKTQNVCGYLPGRVHPDSFLVFTAHYDHLGRMGSKTYFPGANDNASGIAMLLNLASHYSVQSNLPDYSTVFIAFAAEEAGLLGSKFFTENPLIALNKIRFLINMDLMGTGEEGMMVVNGHHFTSAYNRLVTINKENGYLTEIKARGKAKNSDHYWFTEAGVNSFFFYTLGGPKFYHDIYDRAETLPLTEFEDIFRLITDFVHALSE